MHFPAQLVGSPQLVGHSQIREFTPPGLQKMEELQMPLPQVSMVSSLHEGQSQLLSFSAV